MKNISKIERKSDNNTCTAIYMSARSKDDSWSCRKGETPSRCRSRLGNRDFRYVDVHPVEARTNAGDLRCIKGILHKDGLLRHLNKGGVALPENDGRVEREKNNAWHFHQYARSPRRRAFPVMVDYLYHRVDLHVLRGSLALVRPTTDKAHNPHHRGEGHRKKEGREACHINKSTIRSASVTGLYPRG